MWSNIGDQFFGMAQLLVLSEGMIWGSYTADSFNRLQAPARLAAVRKLLLSSNLLNVLKILIRYLIES